MSAQSDPFIYSPANGGWGQQVAPVDEHLCEAENLWGHQCGRGPNSWWVMQDGSTAKLCWQHSDRNRDDPRHRGYRDPRGRPTCEEAEVALKRSREWHAIKQAKEQSSNMSNADNRLTEWDAAISGSDTGGYTWKIKATDYGREVGVYVHLEIDDSPIHEFSVAGARIFARALLSFAEAAERENTLPGSVAGR